MQLKTILNRVERHKSFVYGKATMGATTPRRPTIEVPDPSRGPTAGRSVRAAASGGRATTGCRSGGSSSCRCGRSPCSSCMRCGGSIAQQCGVMVEQVPWCGRQESALTTSYRWFLAGWAKRLSWKEVAEVFHTTWEHVCDAVQHAVCWGLVHRELDGRGGDRRGRDPVAARPPLPDAGLPDRRGLQAAVVDRPGADARTACGSSSTLLGEIPAARAAVRVQRHVAAVPERDRRAGRQARSTCWTASTS